MPKFPSAIMNKADARSMLSVFSAEHKAAEALVARLTREQAALIKEGDAVFDALHKAAFASKKKFDKRIDELGFKVASAKKALEKATATLAEARSNLKKDTGSVAAEVNGAAATFFADNYSDEVKRQLAQLGENDNWSDTND